MGTPHTVGYAWHFTCYLLLSRSGEYLIVYQSDLFLELVNQSEREYLPDDHALESGFNTDILLIPI